MHYSRYVVLALTFIIPLNFTLFSEQTPYKGVDPLKTIKFFCKSFCHTYGVSFYSLKRGELIYAKNADKLFTPASNTKLFSSLAALQLLGKEYTFITELVTDGYIQEGTLYGNLYLKGSGDPSLTMADLEKLFKKLFDQGVATITGSILMEQSIGSFSMFAPGYMIEDVGRNWSSFCEELIVGRKIAAFYPFFTSTLRASKTLSALYFDMAEFLTRLFTQHSCSYHEGFAVKKGSLSYTTLAKHSSEPLLTLLKKTMKESDNMYADCIFQKIGSLFEKEVNGWAKSSQQVQKFVYEVIQVPPNRYKIADGSGLSRYNLLSPDQIVKLLRWASTQPFFADFLELLPTSGIDGTLKDRMVDMPSKVRAKTGSMGGVSSLSGYIDRGDDLIVFSILSNGFIPSSFSCKTDFEDALCRLIVQLC